MPGFGYTLVYVKVESTDIEEIRNEFLTYLGGQRHVKCQQHQLCLVTSMNKKNKCQCGKHEYYRCPYSLCSSCICKTCFDALNVLNTSYVNNNDGQSSRLVAAKKTFTFFIVIGTICTH